jgi:micrococcal nuclease
VRPALLLVILALAAPSTATGAPAARASAVCGDYADQAAAQAAADTRDADGDGVFCESLPCPCSTAVGKDTPGPATPPRVPAAPVKRAQTIPARVVGVVDGDTIKVRTRDGRRRTVRLIGLDTPETRKPGRGVECGGRQATAAMRRLVLDRRGKGLAVVLTTDPTQDRTDRYGRLLAYVANPADVDVGLRMVALGWARTYVYDGKPFRRVAAFERAEARAKAAASGVHGACGGDFHLERQ